MADFLLTFIDLAFFVNIQLNLAFQYNRCNLSFLRHLVHVKVHFYAYGSQKSINTFHRNRLVLDNNLQTVSGTGRQLKILKFSHNSFFLISD